MKRIFLTTMVIILLAGCGAETSSDYPISAVHFSQVTFTGEFIAPRVQTNNAVTIQHNFAQCEETGRLDNFAFAGGLKEGEQSGYFFNDSDVYKNIEAAAYALHENEDAELEAASERVIELIIAAQEDDGYIYTARTAYNEENPPPGGEARWSNIKDGHELYCAGHMYEAAVAWYHATGNRNFLDAALKNADLICETFGPGKIEEPPGHQEIEIGLTKLYRETGEIKYLEMARFFLDARGRNLENRESNLEYDQDHKPVSEQEEVVGHAVRANYMYSAMADVAAHTGDNRYLQALHKLWDNANYGKVYITGGYGATSQGEAFGESYELPNMTAYCETCSSIAGMFWNYRMFRFTGDAKYMDSFERTFYNAFLAAVQLDGKHFFYPNPLESIGQHQRSQWFKCACCPPNVARFLASLGGYVYGVKDDKIYVNLYADNEANLQVEDREIRLTQSTRYPWSGEVEFSIDPEQEGEFALALRIPVWATGSPVHSDTYQYLEIKDLRTKLSVNGEPVSLEIEDGYAIINRRWQAGDTVTLELPMDVRRVLAHHKVAANRGRVALERGPVVYCVEWPDVENGGVRNLLLKDDVELSSEFRADLLGGVQVITGEAVAYSEKNGSLETRQVDFAAIPYHAWAHRGPGEMQVWLARGLNAVDPETGPTLASKASVTASAGRNPEAVNDLLEPGSSADAAYPFFYLRPHEGTRHWIQYEFDQPQRVSSVDVYWLDWTGKGIYRLPEHWELKYRQGGGWVPVNAQTPFPTRTDAFTTVEFDAVNTDGLRIELELQEGQGGGIHEWKVY